ncbi:MAG: hypothetical protein ACP5HC_08380 [Caldisericum sp.]
MYNYEAKSLEVVTLKNKYVASIEIFATKTEKGNLGTRKDIPELQLMNLFKLLNIL